MVIEWSCHHSHWTQHFARYGSPFIKLNNCSAGTDCGYGCPCHHPLLLLLRRHHHLPFDPWLCADPLALIVLVVVPGIHCALLYRVKRQRVSPIGSSWSPIHHQSNHPPHRRRCWSGLISGTGSVKRKFCCQFCFPISPLGSDTNNNLIISFNQTCRSLSSQSGTELWR